MLQHAYEGKQVMVLGDIGLPVILASLPKIGFKIGEYRENLSIQIKIDCHF